MELFALESSGAYLKSIALRVTKYWLPRRESLSGFQAGVLLSARRKISPGYFQSLGTNSCELIVIGRARGALFAQHIILCFDHVCSYFSSPLLYTIDLGRSPKRKSAKVLFMANYGMRVAMNIGVIHDDVMSFYRLSPSRRLRSFGCKFSCKGMGSLGFSVAKGAGSVR